MEHQIREQGLSMIDNQNIDGVDGDEWRPCKKPKGKARKPFVIWCRYRSRIFPGRMLKMHQWHICRRYETEAQRDEALRALRRGGMADWREYSKEKPEGVE